MAISGTKHDCAKALCDFSVALILAIVSPAFGDESQDDEALKGCGVACLYYFHLNHDPSLALEKVVAAIRRRTPDPDFSKLSLYDIAEASRDLGIPLHAVKCDRRSIRRLKLPAILYVRPERLRVPQADAGHMVILTHFTPTGVRLFDPLHYSSAEYPWEEFWDGYDGELLTKTDLSLSAAASFAGKVLALLSLIASGFCFVRWMRQSTPSSKRGKTMAVGVCVAVFASVVAPGCSEEQTALAFEQTTKVSTARCSEDIHVRFPFRVTAREGAVIRDILPSCGCIKSASLELRGKPLPRGYSGTVAFSVEDPELMGQFRGQVVIKTNVGQPSVLTFHGTIPSTALTVVTPVPISVQPLLGCGTVCEIVLSRLRMAGISRLEFIKEESVLGRYEVVDWQVSDTEVAAEGIQVAPAIRETHVLAIRSPSLHSLESCHEAVKLVFLPGTDGQEPHAIVEIPITCVPVHPLQVRDSPVFLGYLQPGEEYEAVIEPLDRTLMLASFGQVECQSANIQAWCDVESGKLHLRGVAPRWPGRFSAEVKLLCKEESLAFGMALNVIATGIVH